MADQWIDAATALSIVSKDAFDRAGKISLCTRAHQGLVRAHARLFVSSRSGTDDRRARDFLIPRNLWWAQGHEALEQDWKSGDFSTWIDRRIHLQAFGTRFALTDVLEMLSYEQRAGIARRLSVVGSEEWVSTPKAIELIKGVEVARDPKQFIVEQARLGFIAARAIEAQRFEEHSQTEPLWAEREWDVPSWFWERRGWCSEDEDWGTGSLNHVRRRVSAQV